MWRLARSGVLVCLAVGWSSVVAAQSDGAAPPAKVGVIDVQRLFEESKTGQEILVQLKNLKEQKTAEGVALKQVVDDLQARLQDGRMSLAEDRIVEMEKELEDRMLELRRFADDAERAMQKEQDQAFARIEREVMPIIGRVGQEQGYTMLFSKFESGLIYAAEAIEITDLVLQIYDAGVSAEDASVEE